MCYHIPVIPRRFLLTDGRGSYIRPNHFPRAKTFPPKDYRFIYLFIYVYMKTKILIPTLIVGSIGVIAATGSYAATSIPSTGARTMTQSGLAF